MGEEQPNAGAHGEDSKHIRLVRRCEEKSKQFVDELIECNIPECEIILKKIKYITQDQYKDVVEERAIVNNCGYPLCKNHLKPVPKQQYKIMKNKVYDLTERKYFCSNKCYESSKLLHSYVPTTALWLRDKEPDVTLPEEVTGKPGKEVKLLEQIPKKVISDLEKDVKKKLVTFKSVNENIPTVEEVKEHEVKNKEIVDTYIKNANKETLLKKVEKRKDFCKMSFEVMHEWLSSDTLEHLKLKKKGVQRKTLNAMEVEEYRQRVEQFYGLSSSNSNQEEKKIKTLEIKEKEATTNPVLPTVDSCSQMQIRRKILYKKIIGNISSVWTLILLMYSEAMFHYFFSLTIYFQEFLPTLYTYLVFMRQQFSHNSEE